MAITLTFSPRYVDFVIRSWQEKQLQSIEPDDLEQAAIKKAQKELSELNKMGLLEEVVSPKEIASALKLLKNMKLIKETKSGPKTAKIAKIMPTKDGVGALNEQAVYGIHSELVTLLTASSADLQQLLEALQEQAFIDPVVLLQPGAPQKGKIYGKLIKEGLLQFREQNFVMQDFLPLEIFTSSSTPNQMIKTVVEAATQHHSISKVKNWAKVIGIAEELGLIWIDEQPINEVTAARYIGLAAITEGKTFKPWLPTFEEVGEKFTATVIQAHERQAGGSGFITIEQLRGAIGHKLHLSRQAIDALLCMLRELTDQEESSLRLHFEPNEEVMYDPTRRPLIWRGHAFDLIALTTQAQNLTAYRAFSTVHS